MSRGGMCVMRCLLEGRHLQVFAREKQIYGARAKHQQVGLPKTELR
jgi:hypothetical protein